MNQISGSGVGGADGLQQHQQMQDVVGLTGPDPQFAILRNNMREKLFEYIGRKQLSADWRRRLPEITKRLEDILFRKFSNKNDYYNMMKGPVETQLQFAIKALNAQNQQNQQNQQMSRQMASSSGYGTMIPTPGIMQGTSGNSRMPYVTDNTSLSSSGAGMVPQNASIGTSLPGSVSNGYQHLTTSVPLNSTTSSVPSTLGPVGFQRQVTHMIPTQQNVPANPDYSNGAGYFTSVDMAGSGSFHSTGSSALTTANNQNMGAANLQSRSGMNPMLPTNQLHVLSIQPQPRIKAEVLDQPEKVNFQPSQLAHEQLLRQQHSVQQHQVEH